MIRKKRMGKGIAKILSGLLVFGMVAGLIPAVPGGTVHAKAEGESEQNVTTAENPEHKHCVCGKGEHPNDGHDYKEETWTGIKNDEQLKNITADGHYYLENNVTIQSAWNCPDGVTLCLNGHSITREGSDEQDIYGGGNAVIKINQNISFALTDCQETVGTITHKAGVSGEGVYNAGKFTMYNGKLSGNNGGVTNQGTFEMYGGTICQNTAEYGGGVYNKNTGTFNMYSGTITDNKASTAVYGNYDDGGGGVYNEGMFSMSGGHIFQNKSTDNGGGVYNEGGTFEMSGGEISNNTTTNDGGGVFNKRGIFTMSDGTTISGNEAMYGGGVYKESGTFTMSGGTITGNEVRGSGNASGGGVYNDAEAFTMSGGAITQNKSRWHGGGVYNKCGTFKMTGGAITGNETKEYGGGVYNESAITFNMSGTAEISNNKATTNVGGVFASTDSKITLSDAVKITGNTVGEIANNLFIVSPSNLYAQSLADGAKIGVTANDTPIGDSSVPITNDATKAEYFISDNSAYETTNDNGLVVLKLRTEKTYAITATAGVNGSISPSGSVNVKEGKGQEFTITPNQGYEIASLKVDGTEVENPSNTYTFTNVTSNHTIDVSFKEQAVVPPAVEAPSITKQPQPVSVKVGETATFTVEAAGADLSYQWMVDKNDNRGFVDIAGATSESYTLNAISKEYNGYRYQCMVSIPSGHTGHTISDCVTLTVTEDAAPTPNPNPTPTPEPTPEPNPTPAPNPTPEATSPTPDPAPATSTPAASTTTAPASSAAAAPAQVTYDILDGAGSSWTQNTDGSLAIRGSGEISKFREVKVDGVTVDPVNYTVTEGSTIITFKPEYLKSLSTGNHSFELVWTDGTAATNFTVTENADQSAKSPKTGEDFSMALCTALLMMSCAGLAGMFVRRKKSSLR